MRRCSGSSSPHPLGLSIHWSPSSSSPPAPRHLQVCLAWTLFLAAAARTRLTLARGRPASLPLPAMRTPLEACGASFRVESIAMESFDLESAGAHARSSFEVGQGHLMGGDFEPGRLGPAHASTASTPPGPPLLVGTLFSRKIASFVRRVCAGDAPRRFHCLPCAPRSRRVRCFLSCGIDCHGVLRP